MLSRLRALPWEWITLAAAYCMAVLPITGTSRMIVLTLMVMLAYLVLAVRTTRATVEIANTSPDQSVFALWRTAFRTTLIHRAFLALPMFCLILAAQYFIAGSSYHCSTLLQAFCSMNGNMAQNELVVIAVIQLGAFLLLDHGLLIALTLLANKHLVKSPVFVSNTAIGLRFALACTILGVGAVSLNIWETLKTYDSYYPNITLTERRVSESFATAFEPLVTTGVLLNANVLSHPSYCAYMGGSCDGAYDTRPFVARQMVSALLGMLMYGLLILGTLRLVAPFSLHFDVVEKTKRGMPAPEPELDITYL